MLDNFLVMDTSSLNEARQIVGKRFCSHRLEISNSTGCFHARHSAVHGNMIALNYLSYGDNVNIEPGELESFYLIQIPIRGTAQIQNGSVEFLSDTHNASILNPDRHTKMTWHSGCQQLMVYIPKDNLLRIAERHLNRKISQDIVFEPQINFDNRTLEWLRSAVILMARAADQGDLFNPSEHINQKLCEESFLIALLERQPNNIQCFMTSGSKQLASKNAKIALDYIIENAGKSICLQDIALSCDLPIRTLQHQFKMFYGTSPTELLKQERLKRVYSEIASGYSNESVSQIAQRWGFSHAGRFSKHFKDEFGQLPSEVSAKARIFKNIN